MAEGREYSILTAEIASATFGLTPGQHMQLKKLEKARGANLRDHMTDLELIFTMLGEAGTTEIAKRRDAQCFRQNRHAAREGGAVAGNARKELEAKSGTPVVSRTNYLNPPQTTSAEFAVAAFVETQTEALAATPKHRAKTRAKVEKTTKETVAALRDTKSPKSKKKPEKKP